MIYFYKYFIFDFFIRWYMFFGYSIHAIWNNFFHFFSTANYATIIATTVL